MCGKLSLQRTLVAEKSFSTTVSMVKTAPANLLHDDPDDDGDVDADDVDDDVDADVDADADDADADADAV